MKFSVALCILTLCAVSGCGLKYDLYLPEPETAQTVDTADGSAGQGQLTLFDSSRESGDNSDSSGLEETAAEE